MKEVEGGARVNPGWKKALPAWRDTRFLVVAGAVWAGALVGREWWGLWGALIVGVTMAASKRSGIVVVMAAGLVAGAYAGWGSVQREAATWSAHLIEGEVTLRAVARTDPKGLAPEQWLLARPLAYLESDGRHWQEWLGPVLMVEPGDAGAVAAGEVFEASGSLKRRPGRIGNAVYAARMWSGPLTRVSVAQGWPVAVGNALRRRVQTNLRSGPSQARALVAGFLIGDTSGLSPIRVGQLRRSGLSHFVAVSGGNVALFLGGLWLVMWPVATRPRIKALVGLVALGVFVVITRWEPSVLRAALLAALVLTSRAMGFPLSGWAALGVATSLALVVSPELASNVGFALSVAATLGVMVGARMSSGKRPRWVWQTLGAALGAQVAVAPLLLWVFGSLPLLSPLANLAAVPLVTVATGLGGIGALTGWQPLVWLAAAAAEGVLAVAGFLSPFPQLGWSGASAVALMGLVAWRWPEVRMPMWSVGLVLFVAVSTLPALVHLVGPARATAPAVVFLDVGQGDSILVLGTEMTVLIDGGPDPVRLVEKLREYRVNRVDLVVLTHPHADHVRGLEGVLEAIPVGAVWDASHPHQTPSHRILSERIEEKGIEVHRPFPGQGLRAGELAVEVLGPLRRYQDVNDQSIVVLIDLGGTSFLMSGDIEEVAQKELGVIGPDVLKVPHQGAATSDPGWLRQNAGRLAVISVGPNDYGHPAAWVEEVLAEGGAQVVRTDRHGDVIVKPTVSR